MANTLKNRWLNLTDQYNVDRDLSLSIFNDLKARYAEPQRHYHTFQHIDEIFGFFDEAKHLLSAPNAIAFTLFFHDAIYNTHKPDNEAQSANFAADQMRLMGIPEDVILTASEMIKATGGHKLKNHGSQSDMAYMLDIDLSIFAAKPERYTEYTEQIRREWHWIEDEVFFKTRRKDKILIPYSAKDIFKTPYFQKKYEALARQNVEGEIKGIEKWLAAQPKYLRQNALDKLKPKP